METTSSEAHDKETPKRDQKVIDLTMDEEPNITGNEDPEIDDPNCVSNNETPKQDSPYQNIIIDLSMDEEPNITPKEEREIDEEGHEGDETERNDILRTILREMRIFFSRHNIQMAKANQKLSTRKWPERWAQFNLPFLLIVRKV